MIKRLWTGLAFLSRLPVPRAAWEAADLGKAALLFPLVGALLGGIEAAALAALGAKVPPLLGAMVLLTVHVLITGALHLDGVADMADGFGGGHTREDVLRIMRDHAIGAFGVIALFLVLGTKVATLSSLLATASWRAPIVAATLGRWSTVVLARLLPYARRGESGLGAALTDHVGPAELGGATGLAIAITIALMGARGCVYLGVAAGVTALFAGMCKERIGGVTGDTLGAATEGVECAIYVLAVTVA
jgi:cobalamin 5'-phosphate synthase/cobalamin synthase